MLEIRRTYSVSTGVYSATSSGRKHKGIPPGRGGKVQLDALDLVLGREFFQHLELVIANFLVCHSAAFGHAKLWVHPAVARHAHTGEELHALVVRAVDQHREGIEPAIDEALHVVPNAPVGRHLERPLVGAEAHADFRRMEQAVAAFDAIDEGIDRRPRHFVHRPPGVLHGHRGLEDKQVVMAGIVEIDGATLAPRRGALRRTRGCAGSGKARSRCPRNALNEISPGNAHHVPPALKRLPSILRTCCAFHTDLAALDAPERSTEQSSRAKTIASRPGVGYPNPREDGQKGNRGFLVVQRA